MSENIEANIDMVSVPKRSFWRLTLPIMAFVLFNAIYGIVDMYWVSNLDSSSYYAVGVSIPIFTLICSIGDSLGQGTNSLMSRSIGANEYRNAYNTLLHGLIISIGFWVILALSVFFLKQFLIMAKLNQAINLIIIFLRPMFLCSIVFILPNFFAETLQAEGDSRRPTAVIVLCTVLNLLLDPIFIFNFNWGIRGAAYATVLASFISTSILICLYLGRRTKIPLSFKYFELKPHIFMEIFKVAIPNFIEDSLFCTAAVFINGILLASMGQIGVLLYATSIKLQTLLISPVRAYGRGLMSVSGHLYGSQKIDEVKRMYTYVLRVSLITMAIVSVFFILFRNIIYYSFSIIGMELAVEHIAIIGTLILICTTVTRTASKMLNCFGLGYYTLIFTSLNVVLQMILIALLDDIFLYGSSVLIGIAIAQFLIAILFYVFLEFMFRKFERQKENGELVVI